MYRQMDNPGNFVYIASLFAPASSLIEAGDVGWPIALF